MSKYTKSPLCRITKITDKIDLYLKRLNTEELSNKQRKRFKYKISCLKKSLRHYAKLYVWAVAN